MKVIKTFLKFYLNDESRVLVLKKIVIINIKLKIFDFKDQDLFLINNYLCNKENFYLKLC